VAPAIVIAAVRHALAELDSSLPLFNVRTMDGVIAMHASGQEFITGLLGLFAALALLLASVGIYGVLSYLVTQRTREIGIRMSLGATRGNVLRLVLAHGMRLAIAGFVLGIGAALASRRVLAGSLRMIKANDPAMYVWACLALALVALAACYIPARRATKVDPMVALRCE